MKSTITLAMMAHNEARYLPRVQSELGDRINSVVIISDPPNSDGTIEVAKDIFNPYNLRIIERPWPSSSFAASITRNQILLHARTMGDDYVLWLDPDSPFIGTIPDILSDPLYALLTVDRSSNISWWQVHLIRSDINCRWRGRVHEYLDTGQLPITCLNIGKIDRDGSGGGVKAMREVHLPLLLMDINDNPMDPRAWYYLAQTYRDLGETDLAIDAYKHRIALNGFDQETFYSYYMIGCLYMINKGDDIEGEKWLLRAYTHRPSRTEPLNQLIEIYKRKGGLDSLLYAMQLMNNRTATPPTQDVLLVQNREL